jgi:hypothetical protein
VHAYYGIRNDHKTGSWDGQVKQYDFTVGNGNDRGDVLFNATYREQNEIYNAARELTRRSIAGSPPGVGGFGGTPKGRIRLFGPAVSGRAFGLASCGTYDPARSTETLCDRTLINAPAPPSLDFFKHAVGGIAAAASGGLLAVNSTPLLHPTIAEILPTARELFGC